MPNFDDIAKILAIIGTIAGGLLGINKAWTAHRKGQRARQLPAGDFPFEVIKPGSPNLLKQIMGGDEQNPLADCNIPYQKRQPDRNVRQELEAAFAEKNWVLILGKSGLGKTREAAHLAEVLNKEGWTVLKLVDQPGEWLDVPKQFPSEISPDDKLLFFLDDLNRWMYAGNPHEIHPKAGEDLAQPLRKPVQERLPRLLQYFEQQGKSPYVRVIATARDEREPDKSGNLSPWEKLQWEKYKSFWQQFQRYSLGEPSEGAIVRLLTDCVAAAGLQGNPAEYGQMARRNDGTFRNITLNLASAQNRGLAVNDQEFSPKLDETWRRRYNKVVQRYPLAKHVYDAVELLRTLNLGLTAPMLVATTQRLLPGRGLRRWWQVWQLESTQRYLVSTEQILNPKDGQIEAKRTVAVAVGRYVPVILQLLGQMAKRNPTYPVATEYFNCGNELFKLNCYEEAIASYKLALAIQPDSHQTWNNQGYALFNLSRYEEAIASFDQAVVIQPDYHEAWYNRGLTLHAVNRYEDAIGAYDKALVIQPDLHEAWNNRGSALRNLHRYEDAISSYEKAVAVKPDKHEAWNNRGLALSDLNCYEDAISSFDQALAIKPNFSEALYSRGLAFHAMKRYKDAITSYDKAMALKPDHHDVFYNKGNALSALGRYEEAITAYDQAVAVKPDCHAVWYNRGLALRNLNRFEDAIASYDQAVAIKPDFQEALHNRGIALGNLNRFEEAIAAFDQALEFKPNDHETWYNRGLVLVDLERKEEAIVSYDKAIKINPDKHRAWYNKACCYSLQEQIDLALVTLHHAITLDPKYRDIAKTDSDFDGIRSDSRFQALLNPSQFDS